MIVLVNFGTRTPDHDHQPMMDAIIALGGHCQCYDSTWLLDVNLPNTHAIFEHLVPHVGEQDGLVVTEVNVHSVIGRFPDPVIQWLKEARERRR